MIKEIWMDYLEPRILYLYRDRLFCVRFDKESNCFMSYILGMLDKATSNEIVISDKSLNKLINCSVDFIDKYNITKGI